MISEINSIRARIDGAAEVVEAGEDIRPHLEWEACQMVSNLSPQDLTTLELASLIGVLHAAHARLLGDPSDGGPSLRLVTLKTAQLNQPAS